MSLDPTAAETPDALIGQPQTSTVGLGIWELAWPAILGNLLHSTVAIVDGVAVGSLGAPALAAATAGERIFFVLQAVLMGVTAGTTALVARAWGGGQRDEASRVTSASLFLCLGVAAVASLLGIAFTPQLLGIFGLDDLTTGLAVTYVRWLLLFNPFFAIYFALGAALRAAGDTRTPLWIGALANVLNAALIFPLVFGSFGFPSLGIAGAAIAGGSSFAVCGVLFVWLWQRGSLAVRGGGPGSIERKRVERIARIGYPAALEQGAFQLGFVIFLWFLASYGSDAPAAYGVGGRVLAFSFVIGSGFSVAASTLVGQHLGAGDPAGAARSGWRSTFIATALMAVFGLAITLAAEPIARFVIDDDDVVRLAVIFIYILGAVQPLMALEFCLAGALRGAGDTRFPLVVVLAGMLVVRSSLAGLAAWWGLSVGWVFAALIGDYTVKALLLTGRFRSGRWQHAVR
ncbi:MAG: MATE family efflux transporter [Myxococcota bacterium]|nr:MATE family efflux transporter [Myxococcota bacterium]